MSSDTLPEKKEKRVYPDNATVLIEVVTSPSPWYLVGLRDGERTVACLEHVKYRAIMDPGIFWNAGPGIQRMVKGAFGSEMVS